MNTEERDVKQEVALATIIAKLEYIEAFIKNAPDMFASKPVEKLVYGLVGLVMITIGTAVVAGALKAMEWIAQ